MLTKPTNENLCRLESSTEMPAHLLRTSTEDQEDSERQPQDYDDVDQQQHDGAIRHKLPQHARHNDDDTHNPDNDDDDDPLSSSEHSEGASTVDMAEENEKKVRRSLLVAILSVCGLLVCMQVVGRLLARLYGGAEEEDAAAMATDEAVGAAREGVVANAATSGTTGVGGVHNPAL